MGFFSDDIPRGEIQSWLLNYIYRVDMGLFEIEKDYKKRGIIKKLKVDQGYNQLCGKLHVCFMLMQDFNFVLRLSDRIKKRIVQHGGKLKKVKK